MSGQLTEDSRPLLDRCLVVIFKEKKSKNGVVDTAVVVNDYEVPVSLRNTINTTKIEGEIPSTLDNTINTRGAATTDTKLHITSGNNTKPVIRPLTGKELYEEFVIQNKGCFWDPHLEESLNNVQVLGYVYPHTVLIGGRDIYLDTVRSAWARKVLQPPTSFTIHRIGELRNIEMQLVAQAQFTPLPEALCMIISDINKAASIPATFEEILKQLKKKYRNVHQPSEEIVYEALGNLLKERKIYHTGHGYHIITPELFAHLNHINGFATLQECGLSAGRGGNSLLMPVPSLPVPEMSSIACQTEQVEEHLPDKDDVHKKKLHRSNSLREAKKSGTAKEKKGLTESFSRTTSLRLDQEKARGLVKDINLKTSDVHQEKDKDKTSLLSKIFGSGKSKKQKQPQVSIPEEDTVEQVEQQVVEYATFSAQFPPPDLQWYDTQAKAAQLLQRPTVPERRIVSKSGTFHHLQRPNMLDAESQSDVFDDEYPLQHCPIHKSKTLPENITGLADLYHSRMHQRSSSSHSQDSRNSQIDCIDINNLNSSESKALLKYNNECKSYRERSKKGTEQMDNWRGSDGQNLNDVCHVTCVDQSTTDYYGGNGQQHSSSQPKPRKVYSPKDPEAIYEDICDIKKNPSGKCRTVLNNGGDVDPVSVRQENEDFETRNTNNGHGMKPPLPINARSSTANGRGFKNSSHKNRIYKRYKEMHCGSVPTCKDDISIEYNSRMPVKTSSFGKSRDSGVNCIGLPELQPCITMPISEGSNSLNCSVGEGEYVCQEDTLTKDSNNGYNQIYDGVQRPGWQQQSLGMTSTPNQYCSNNDGGVTMGNIDVVVHQAEIHKIPEEGELLHGVPMNNCMNEDSGFNSPHQGNLAYSPYSYSNNQHPVLGTNSFTTTPQQHHHHHQNNCCQVFSGKTLVHSNSAVFGGGNHMNNNNNLSAGFSPYYGEAATTLNSNGARGFIETDLDHPSMDGFPREGSPPIQEEDKGEVDNNAAVPRAFQLLAPENINNSKTDIVIKKSHGGRHQEKRGKHSSKRERPKSVREDRVYHSHDVHIQGTSKLSKHNGLNQNIWTGGHNAQVHDNKHSSRRSLTHLDKQKIENSLQHRGKQGDFEVVGVV